MKYSVKNNEIGIKFLQQSQEKVPETGEVIIVSVEQKDVTNHREILIECANAAPEGGYTTVKEMDMDLKLVAKLEKFQPETKTMSFEEAEMLTLKAKVAKYKIGILHKDLRDFKAFWEDWKPKKE